LLSVVLGLAIVFLITLLTGEIRRYREGSSPLDKRRFVLRLISGLLLISLLLAIFVGVVILKVTAPDDHPLFFLIYWLACLSAALGLIVLALLDMLKVRQLRSNRGDELWKDLSRIIAAAEEDKKKQP